MRRASSLLTAMPRSVSLRHQSKSGKVTEVTLNLRGNLDVMQDGTILRYWTDEDESVIMAMGVTPAPDGPMPRRTMMLTSRYGKTPMAVAQRVIGAFFPDDTAGMAASIEHEGFTGNIWLMHTDEVIKIMAPVPKPTKN